MGDELSKIVALGRALPPDAGVSMLRELVERLPLLVMGVGERHELVLWNREAARVTGYPSEQMIGDPRYLERLYPDDDYREELVVDDAADDAGMHRRELTLVTRAGVERTISWTSMRRELGFPGLRDWFVGLDVTDIRRAERELRANAEMLRKAHTVAHLGAWRFDLASQALALSPEARELFGLTDSAPADLASLLELVHPDDRAIVLERVERMPIDGALPFELRIVRPDGALRIVRAEGDFLDPADPDSTVTVGIVHDVTEQRRLESRLRQAQKMEALGRLARGIAHDLNNVLTVIGGSAELIRDRLPVGDPGLEEVEAIDDSFDHARTLVSQLLAIGRRQVLRPTVFELNEAVTHLVPMLRRVAGAGADVTTLLEDGAGLVECDRSQLEQVLLELVVHARDATGEGGRLSIATGREVVGETREVPGAALAPGCYAVLAVRHEGRGMDEDTLARIFEPFHSEERGSAGLGLATVHGIVDQSGGRITVDSAPERGTTFTVYLPQHQGDVPDHVAADAPSIDRRGNGERLLLVEDDALVRGMVTKALEAGGYQVVIAANGDEAQRMCARGDRFDLVITDVVMPLMTGLELVEWLQAERPEMGTLIISGYVQGARVPKGERLDFLAKPFTPSTLLAKVSGLLSR